MQYFGNLLRPAGPPRLIQSAVAVVPLLVVSAVLVIVAAWAMPTGYSWRLHSISESAAQGLVHAWIARLSFLSFGAAVLLLSVVMRDRWPRITYWCNLIFAGSMFGAATFSHSPWQSGVANDPLEDVLHSVFASGMGLAFCVGVAARLLQRGPGNVASRALDILALLVATVLPLMLASASGIGGLMQRVMFVVGYIWFGREALIGLGIVRDDRCVNPLRSAR